VLRVGPALGFLITFSLVAPLAVAAAAPGEAPRAAADGLLRVRVVGTASTGATMSVVVTSGNDVFRRWTTPVGPAADAVFDRLPPAAYEVQWLFGGTLAARITVPVGPSEMVSLRAAPSATPGEFELSVIDRHDISQASAFDARLLADLPSSRDIWALVETNAPFVIVDRIDGGGAAAARSPRVGSRAASWTSTTVALGDVVVQDPGRTGGIDIAPDAAFVDGVAVSAGLAPVEVGTPGVRIVLSPRRPGTARSAELFGSLTAPGMVATNAIPGAPSDTRLASWREGGLVAGGPLTDRVGGVMSASLSGARYFEPADPESRLGERASLFGHVISNVSPRDQVRVVFGAQRVKDAFDDRRQFASRDATESARLIQTQLTWDRQLDHGSAWAVLVGVQTAQRTPNIDDPTGGVVDRVTDGFVPSPAARTSRPSFSLGARWHDRERRWRSISY
jgi:hypothetical protein